jgi:hypothetical protein
MDFTAHVKSVIEQQTCAIHHRHPKLEISGKQVIIDCCCARFKIVCLKYIIHLLQREKQSQLSLAWKHDGVPGTHST